MSRDEQIEKMAKLLGDTWIVDLEGAPHDLSEVLMRCDIENIAEQLYDAGYRKQEWISVDEALPEKGTYVLCYFKYEPESPDVICENLYHGGKLWLSEGSKVTHWMLLPEPPKMRKEDEGK